MADRHLALLALAALGFVALRFGGAAANSRTQTTPTSPREASTLPTEEVQFPGPREVIKATDFAARRAGNVSFAVVDTTGALSCYRCRVRYHSASVVKAMLLVAYLNRLAGEHKELTRDHEAYLNSMIRVSDNDAATAIYAHVGGAGQLLTGSTNPTWRGRRSRAKYFHNGAGSPNGQVGGTWPQRNEIGAKVLCEQPGGYS